MELVRYTCEGGSLGGLHHRFIQPPQIAYFVTTCDRYGNMNTTPVTMGTCIAHNFFSFTLSNLHTNEAHWTWTRMTGRTASSRAMPICVKCPNA